MFLRFASLGVLFFAVGCTSSSPSEGEIRKELEASFASCELATVENVKRINGEEGSEKNTYLVDVGFVLRLKPVPGAAERTAQAQKLESDSKANADYLAGQISNLDAQIQELNNRRAEERAAGNRELSAAENSLAFVQANGGERSRILGVIHDKTNAAVSAIDEEARPLNGQLYKLQETLSQTGRESAPIRKSITDDFTKFCPFKTRFSQRVFAEGLVNGSINKEQTPLGARLELQYRIPMKKTDNGWVINV